MDKPMITCKPNGPYLVKGLANLRNSRGETVAVDAVVALCRCGGSATKPFCDGTHRKNGFRALHALPMRCVATGRENGDRPRFPDRTSSLHEDGRGKSGSVPIFGRRKSGSVPIFAFASQVAMYAFQWGDSETAMRSRATDTSAA